MIASDSEEDESTGTTTSTNAEGGGMKKKRGRPKVSRKKVLKLFSNVTIPDIAFERKRKNVSTNYQGKKNCSLLVVGTFWIAQHFG